MITLYFLTHPASDLFSGYGIPASENRKNHLCGLIMIDRPQQASCEWLRQVETAFGELKLSYMTAKGERGMWSQLYVRHESVKYIQKKNDPIVPYLEAAVREHCRSPPKVKLRTWWDDQLGLWRSEFYHESVGSS